MRIYAIMLTSFLCFYLLPPTAQAFGGRSEDADKMKTAEMQQQQQKPHYFYKQDQYGNLYYQPTNSPNYYYGQVQEPGANPTVQHAQPVMAAPMAQAQAQQQMRAPASAPVAAAPAPQQQQAVIYTPYMAQQKNYLPHSVQGSETMFGKNGLSKVTAESSLTQLKHGNLRYVQGMSRSSKVSQATRIKMMAGQQPHAVVLTCSDSRVPPEKVFDQSVGDLFVVRNAGPSLDAATVASIEFAVATLGTRMVLVMGHEGCAGLKAAIMTPEGKSTGSPAWDQVVADIKPRLGSLHRQPASVGFNRESNENTRGIVKDLISRSSLIRQRVGSGHLQLRSSFYHMDSGLVDFH